jgi:hypothetical protein
MQLRCQACSTEFTVGDEVVRVLRARNGTVPCRKCRKPVPIEPEAQVGVKPDAGTIPKVEGRPSPKGPQVATSATKPGSAGSKPLGSSVVPSREPGPRPAVLPRTESAPRPPAAGVDRAKPPPLPEPVAATPLRARPPPLPAAEAPRIDPSKPPPVPTGRPRPPTSPHRIGSLPPPVADRVSRPIADAVAEVPADWLVPLADETPTIEPPVMSLPPSVTPSALADRPLAVDSPLSVHPAQPYAEPAQPYAESSQLSAERPQPARAKAVPPPLPTSTLPADAPIEESPPAPTSSMPSPIAIATHEHDPMTADAWPPQRVRRARVGVAAAVFLAVGGLWAALRGSAPPRSEEPTASTTTGHAAVSAAQATLPSVLRTTPPVVETPSAEPIAASAAATPSPAQALPPVVASAPAVAPSPVASAAPPVSPSDSATRDTDSQSKKPASALPSQKLAAAKAGPKTEGPAETELPDPNLAPPRSKSNVDEDALQQALTQAAQRAKSCHVPGGPTGNARVSVTIAPNGEVTGATVLGSLFSSTLEGECIAAKFRSIHIPPFTGGDFMARKTVAIE